MRSAAIWAFGLIGCGLVGLLIGDGLNPRDGGGILGFFGAALVFACIRLWLTSKTSARG